jgi:hypothetical protein
MSTTPCFLPGVTLLAPPNPSFSPVHVTATRGHQWPGEARLAHSMAAGSIEMFYVDPWCILLVILRVFHNELYQKVRVEPPRDLAVMKYDGATPWTSSPSLTTVRSRTNLEDEMKDGDNTIFPATNASTLFFNKLADTNSTHWRNFTRGTHTWWCAPLLPTRPWHTPMRLWSARPGPCARCGQRPMDWHGHPGTLTNDLALGGGLQREPGSRATAQHAHTHGEHPP